MRRPGFRAQLLMVLSLFLFLLNFIVGWIMIQHAQSAFKTQIQGRILDVTNMASAVINGDDYEKITASNAHSEEYKRVLGILTLFTSHSKLDYIYGLRQVGDKEFIFTIDPALSNAAEFGESAVATDALIEASKGVPSVTDEPYTDAYGSFYTAYSPIYNSAGNIVGIVAADCDAHWFNKQMNDIIFTMLCSFIVSMLLGAGIVMLFMRQLQRQFKELNVEMRNLAVDINVFTNKIVGTDTTIDEEISKNIEKEKDVSKSLFVLERQSYDEMCELGNQIRNMRFNLSKHIDEIYSLAFRDPLTGVKSKQAWVEYMHMEDNMIENHSIGPFAVVLCDINGLKQTNDKFGHKAGDKLIKDASVLICEVFSNSPVFRIGGDEFVVVLKGHDYEYRMGLFKQFIETVRQNKREGKVVVAIGMSEYVEADSRIEDVLDRADILMYSNKKQLKQQEGYIA